MLRCARSSMKIYGSITHFKVPIRSVGDPDEIGKLFELYRVPYAEQQI